MNPIRIPITISPHIIGDKPRGFYILAHSLWGKDKPIIFRQQFVGFQGSLILTMAHPSEWTSLVKATIYASVMNGKPISWFSSVQQYPQGTGVRFYLPSGILPPTSAGKIETIGIIGKASYGSGSVVYISIPRIDGDIILGRKELK